MVHLQNVRAFTTNYIIDFSIDGEQYPIDVEQDPIDIEQ